MPWTECHASREWQAILADAREDMGLVSDNSAFSKVQGMLRAHPEAEFPTLPAFAAEFRSTPGIDSAKLAPPDRVTAILLGPVNLRVPKCGARG